MLDTIVKTVEYSYVFVGIPLLIFLVFQAFRNHRRSNEGFQRLLREEERREALAVRFGKGFTPANVSVFTDITWTVDVQAKVGEGGEPRDVGKESFRMMLGIGRPSFQQTNLLQVTWAAEVLSNVPGVMPARILRVLDNPTTKDFFNPEEAIDYLNKTIMAYNSDSANGERLREELKDSVLKARAAEQTANQNAAASFIQSVFGGSAPRPEVTTEVKAEAKTEGLSDSDELKPDSKPEPEKSEDDDGPRAIVMPEQKHVH